MSFQWLQLAGLALVHLAVDMMGGMIPAILPAIRQSYGLSLSAAFTMLAVLNLACNGMQLATGHLRASSRRPLFLLLGLGLTAALCLLGLLPRGAWTLPLLLLLMIVGGSGVAIAHPEGLRAVHALDCLPASVTTVIFMVGGNLGFAGGGWLSALLVSRWGLAGLLLLLLIQPLGLAVIPLLRIRLAVEKDESASNEPAAADSGRQTDISFARLMLLSIPVATAATLLVGYLPTHLHELGFPMPFGGLSTLVFGASGVIGSIIWGILARSRGEQSTVRVCLLAGIPFLGAYLFTMQYQAGLWLLAGAGFCLMAVFPLLVSIARYAGGYNIGRRMAFIVGGSWGAASIVMMLTGIIADLTGVRLILLFTLAVYAVAAGLLLFVPPVTVAGRAQAGEA